MGRPCHSRTYFWYPVPTPLLRGVCKPTRVLLRVPYHSVRLLFSMTSWDRFAGVQWAQVMGLENR